MGRARRTGRSRRTPAVAALALAAAAAGALVAPALAAKDDVVLISRATGPAGAPVDATAAISSASASGEQVAFDTDADNISAEDNNAFRNVFVRDVPTNATTFVSRATGATGTGGDGTSQDPSISGDGRFVAFESDANNLSTEDNNAFTNVFVRDLVAGTTTLVSRASGPGGAGADASAVNPDISSDGRVVTFQSSADNLSADDNNGVVNIFVRDLVADTTTLVSRAPGVGGAGANDNSFNPTISGDGNRVAFESNANNLSNQDNDAVTNAFVRDLAARTNALVSRATGGAGAPANGASDSADISPSGRYVAFRSSANNLSGDDNNAVSNIFLRDLDESTTALMSRASGPGGAGADATSFRPVVSDNARVAFDSLANNLSVDDNDAFGNVYARDALANTTELVSRAPGPAGAAANNNSVVPTTSADGRYVAFQSTATNLVAGTIPGVANIYRRDVLGDAPVATPVCKTLPLPPSPADDDEATFTLSVQQLRINQRISQAAIRRLNAVEARLNGGLETRDLCGYSVGPAQLGPGITSAPAATSLAPASPADPAAIVDPGRTGQGDPITLSAEQLLINQRIDQAAIRRATGITNRLDAGLTGGDVQAGQVIQGKLFNRLQIVARVPAPEPPASKTVIPPRQNPPDPGSVTLSTEQLRINQRIAQAGVRNANALIRRLETGLSGADLRLSTLTAADLG
jgi:TolB protein